MLGFIKNNHLGQRWPEIPRAAYGLQAPSEMVPEYRARCRPGYFQVWPQTLIKTNLK